MTGGVRYLLLEADRASAFSPACPAYFLPDDHPLSRAAKGSPCKETVEGRLAGC